MTYRQACGHTGGVRALQDKQLHSRPIRASSRAFPAGGDGIAPGYARMSIVDMRPFPVEGRDKP